MGRHRENGQDRRVRRATKQQKKKRAAEKAASKAGQGAEEAERDIDEILAEIVAAEKAKQPKGSASELIDGAPSPRSSAALVAHPTKDELLLFGGEHIVGPKTYTYNDLFVFSIAKSKWKCMQLANAPPPRSGHQAVVTPRAGGEMWVFGGEYTSPSGSQFRHYNDLWVLNLADMTWEQVQARNGPSARSGHRMVYYKRKLVVFGGFHDDCKKAPKYFNDLHVFDIETRAWESVEFAAIVPAPAPRSGFQFVATNDTAILYGGYSRKRLKGEVYKGEVHSDMWALNAEDVEDSGDAAAKPPKDIAFGMKWSWSTLRPHGDAPSSRCGATMTLRGNNAYSFGGVCDQETEDALEGEFFDDLYLYSTASNKWHAVELKENVGGGGSGRKQQVVEWVTKGEQQKKKKSKRKQDPPAAAEPVAAAAAEPAAEAGGASPFPSPSPRINPALAVKGNTLYLLGGTFEIGDRVVTFTDMYSLDLGKLNNWVLLHDNDDKTREWLEEESSSSEEEDEEGEGDGEDD